MNDLPAGLRLYRNQLRDAVAHDLARRVRSTGSRPRWALRLAVPTAVVAGAAAALVVFLTGGPQASSADAAILRGVAAALTAPSGTILHERAMVTVAGQAPARYELWAETDSPYAYRVVKFGHEGSWDGSAFSAYDASSNTIVRNGDGSRSSGRSAPDDPAAVLRSLVESGAAKIDGEATLDGIAAYELTVSGAAQRYLNGTVFVAKDDYRPLEIETTTDGPSGPVTETIRYQILEYLPATAASRALLDLAAQHPGAQIVSRPPGRETTTTSK
jgi:hypothetical protein